MAGAQAGTILLLAAWIGGAQPSAEAGEPLPGGVVTRIASGHFRHNDRLRAMVVSPNGKLLATGGGNRLRIWDAATGQLKRQFHIKSNWGHWLAFSADSSILTSADGYHDITCRRFDLATGKVLSNFHVDLDADAELSGDGTLMVVASEDQTARLYDTATGRKTGEFKIERDGRVAVRPDGKALAVLHAKTKTARLHEIPSGKLLVEFQADVALFHSPVFSPDGRSLAANHGKRGDAIRLWDAATGKERLRLEGSRGYHTDICFSSDGKLLAAGGPQAPDFVLWDATTGKLLRRFAPVPSPRQAQLSPDGKTIFSESRDGAILAWDVASGKMLPRSANPITAVRDLRFSADGKRLIGSTDLIRAWDAASGREMRAFPRASDLSALSNDETLLAASDRDGTIRLRDAATGKEIRAWKAHDRALWTLQFSADGKRLFSTGGWEPMLRVWDVVTGQRLTEAGGYRDGIMQIAASPDGRFVATSGNFAVAASDLRLWDLATGRELHRFTVQLQMKHHAVFSPDGRWLAAATRRPGMPKTWGEVQVWEIATGQPLGIFAGHKEMATALAFSTDSRMLATGSTDRSVRLWDLAERRERKRLLGHEGTILSLAFAPDNRRLAASSPEAPVYIWDIAGVTRRERPRAKLSAEDLDALWNELGNDDPAKAYRAVFALAATNGQAVALLQKRLRPESPPDAERLRKLLADLDSEEFAVRDQASAALAKLGDAAAPALRDALTRDPSPEVARRLNALLAKAANAMPTSELLRGLRAVAVLEQLATPEAKRVLDKLGAGAPEARLTLDAQAALKRMASPSAPKN